MPKASKKSDSEKQAGYVSRIAHAVERIDDWTAKIAKASKSRKYSLTDAQKNRVLEHLGENVDKLQSAFASTEKEKVETFKL
jgi:uncharacterized protein with HEPN domain